MPVLPRPQGFVDIALFAGGMLYTCTPGPQMKKNV